MRLVLLLAVFAAFESATAQKPTEAKPLGTWEIEYDRPTRAMHGEPGVVREHRRIALRAIGDSVIGELNSRTGDTTIAILRGTAKANRWTLFADSPEPRGLAVMMSALEAMMEWLRDSIHGTQPTVIRYDLVVKGDSLSGSRTVTGFGAGRQGPTPVSGVRRLAEPREGTGK